MPDRTARDRFAALAAQTKPRWNLDQPEGEASAKLHLYGAIGGWWGDIDAASIVPAIRDLDVDTIHVFVNSPGGDVYDGVAIRNALRQHSARVVVTVDGLAASAASLSPSPAMR
jgi:ATP-dependent protease ClpP protease subunit